MDIGLQKTAVFLCFIFLGILLKRKFASKEELSGIKKIILNLALPATIFIALLSVEVKGLMIWLPLLAIGLNVVLFLVIPPLLPFFGLSRDTSAYRTARLMLPSLAPGLSCFPFIHEFLGDDALAKAAMADLGNKVFVLIVLYIVAMNWHYRIQAKSRKSNNNQWLKMLGVMGSEPVNLLIIAALVLLIMGVNMSALPFVLSETLQKLSLIMTPLVLLFIGLAVKLKREQFFKLFSLLCLRAGIVFVVVGALKLMLGIGDAITLVLLLSFGLSACSFWPYAHIALVEGLEKDSNHQTFDSGFAVNILALSFPFSTLVILSVLNSGNLFVHSEKIFITAGVLFFFASVPALLKRSRKRISFKITKSSIDTTGTEHV
ncbi:MAG: permease [Bacteroidota bacterium]